MTYNEALKEKAKLRKKLVGARKVLTKSTDSLRVTKRGTGLWQVEYIDGLERKCKII